MDSQVKSDIGSMHNTSQTDIKSDKMREPTPELKATERIFAENYDPGPPPDNLFKPGESMQIQGGYDLKLTSLKHLGVVIKRFKQDQIADLVNIVRKTDMTQKEKEAKREDFKSNKEPKD